MFDNYIIEVRPTPMGVAVQAGLVVRDGHGFRFFAATDAFNRLEGRLFETPKAAEKAALHHMAAATSLKASRRRRPEPTSIHTGE